MYQKHQPMKKERIQGRMKKRETGNLAGILAGAGIMIILAGGLIADVYKRQPLSFLQSP